MDCVVAADNNERDEAVGLLEQLNISEPQNLPDNLQEILSFLYKFDGGMYIFDGF